MNQRVRLLNLTTGFGSLRCQLPEPVPEPLPEPKPEPVPAVEPELVVIPEPEIIQVEVSSLPEFCNIGQIARWNGYSWVCGEDNTSEPIDMATFALAGAVLVVVLQYFLKSLKIK